MDKGTCPTTFRLLQCWPTEQQSTFVCHWAFVRAGQATLDYVQLINFYF